MSARYKPKGKKNRLVKRGKQTRWAPFWTVPKKYGKGKRVHPARHTRVKRSWRKVKTDA
ncbi:50S ribosomal protein L39e [Candidatus Woesearchaeota archaeon]|nr:50S ribosomal protein L39e [Candidatus Woesearchaeota archaeon]